MVRGNKPSESTQARTFRVGDRVRLEPNSCPTSGWNLSGGAEGIVTCVPRPSAGRRIGKEQRMVLVSSLREPLHFFFRSSWLQPSALARAGFKIGDKVQLSGSDWDGWRMRDEHLDEFEARCLGLKEAMACGTVSHTGVVRDGVQRNVEVVKYVSSPTIATVCLAPTPFCRPPSPLVALPAASHA